GLRDPDVNPNTSLAILRISPPQLVDGAEVPCTCPSGAESCEHPACAPGYACKNSQPYRCRLNNRIRVLLECATHGFLHESCSGPNCTSQKNPHVRIAKNIIDWIWSGLIFASPGSDHGTFVVSA